MNFLYDPHEAGLEASPRVERAVLVAFRRHHRMRRLRKVAVATALSAAASISILWLMRPAPKPLDAPSPLLVRAAPPQFAWEKSRPVLKASAPRPVLKGVHKEKLNEDKLNAAVSRPFFALPFGDASLIDESAAVVRIELPRSALRLAGFTVAQERANDLVQADVVLGPDGLAHAVRFVEY